MNNLFIDVYPNPANDFAIINFELEKSCNVRILMCDILGKEIAEIHNSFATEGLFYKTINTNNLLSGTYYLKISIDNDKDYVMQKIIKN